MRRLWKAFPPPHPTTTLVYLQYYNSGFQQRVLRNDLSLSNSTKGSPKAKTEDKNKDIREI